MDFLHNSGLLILSLVVLLVSIAMVVYQRRQLPVTNWPVIGMLPDLLLNGHRMHEYATDILKKRDGSFLIKGPWFANMDMLATADPANVHHLLSKNFSNYPKGPNFRSIFDILGDGIFNADDELWEIQRKTTMSLLKHPSFPTLLETTIRNKIEKGILPVLDLVSDKKESLDLQEIFQRFTFDVICILLLDHDPESLSLRLPYIPCEKAFTEVEEGLLWRHLLPEKVWKLQRRFGIGKEKKMTECWKIFDEFIYKHLSRKEDELSCVGRVDEHDSFLTSMMKAFQGQTGTSGDTRKFLKDTILNLMVAGRDTTSTALSWFFYLLSLNPSVEKNIRSEIQNQMKGGKKWKDLSAKDFSELFYLHGGLLEALRLYPPVALEHKSPVSADILPSGHKVDSHNRIVLSFYSMGRMEGIWGKDCMEFKPERWFFDRGSGRKGIKHEPSFKFPAFLAGPRTCLGKDIGMVQMKMVATAVIYHYHVELVEDHEVCPSDSILLQMKYGLKIRLIPVN